MSIRITRARKVSEQINEKIPDPDFVKSGRFHKEVHAELKKVMDKKYYGEFQSSNGGQALDNVINHFGKSRGYRVDKTVKSIIDKYGKNRDEFVTLSFRMAAKARRGIREDYAVIVSMKDDSIEKELEKKFKKEYLGSGGSVDGGRDISFTVKSMNDAQKIEQFVKQRKFKKVVTDVDIFKESVEMDEAKSVPLVRTGQGSFTKDTHPKRKDGKVERMYQAKDGAEQASMVGTLQRREFKTSTRYDVPSKGNNITIVFDNDKVRKAFEKKMRITEENMNAYVNHLSQNTTTQPNKSARLSIDARKEDV